jgi:SacI restriction endonuclease
VNQPVEHAQNGLDLLNRLWGEVIVADTFDADNAMLGTLIDAVLGGKEVGYKKAIIIQLAGKAADFSLDAQCLQKGNGQKGAWDAREFGKRVFVPWNAAVGNPLGDADDPYVSNQFRNLRFDEAIRAKRKNPTLFDQTLSILQAANAAKNVEEVVALLRQALMGVRRMMQGKSFDYPIPQRASIESTQAAVAAFLSVSSGGGRLQAVAHALFKSLSDAGFNYSNLVARHVNTSDASAGASGDVSFSKDGRSTAIEVKDRLLTIAQISASVTKARVAEVTELVFLVHTSRENRLFASEQDEVEANQLASKEFSSGLNVYWESYLRLSRSLLVVLAEQGRRDFLKSVGIALEEQSVDAKHRWEWAKIVAGM